MRLTTERQEAKLFDPRSHVFHACVAVCVLSYALHRGAIIGLGLIVFLSRFIIQLNTSVVLVSYNFVFFRLIY